MTANPLDEDYTTPTPLDLARADGDIDDADDAPVEDERPAKRSAATVLVDLASGLFHFGVSTDGETFAVPKDGPPVVALLRGGKSSLRARLARRYFAKIGKAAPQQALADALLVIEGAAQEEDPVELHLRVADREGETWIDLGDLTGNAVKLTPKGWTIEESAPVLFRRSVLNSALPRPVAGADLSMLWRWLNVAEADRPLVAAWLVATLTAGIPHPVLLLHGEQGTGKTTTQKVLVSVLDPSPVPTRKPPRDAESWVTAAAGSWVVGIDNLSTVPDWLSDSLCRAVTGDGDVRRKLYTDGDHHVIAFRRCIALTGIDLGALRGDLTERLLPIELARIDDGDRLEEGQLWPAWDQQHPELLGAVLDLAAGVMAVAPSVRLDNKPRMADFARVLAAVDRVLGTNGLDHYLAKQSSLATESLTGDPFIAAMLSTITVPFTGTSAELLDLVPAPDRVPKGWPSTSRQVTSTLKRQAPTMRKAAWTVENDNAENHDKVLVWTISPPAARGEKARIPSPQPPHPRTEAAPAGVAGIAGVDCRPSQDDEGLVCRVCGTETLTVDDDGPRHPNCAPALGAVRFQESVA